MMTGCPSDFQVGAHDAALTRPTERALRALAPSRAAVRPARAPTPIRARRRGTARARVVDVRRGGLGRIRPARPIFQPFIFRPGCRVQVRAPPRAPAAIFSPRPRFGAPPSNPEIVRSRPTPARRDQSWWRVDARKLRGTPLAQVCVARFLARPPHARPTPAGRLWWGRETSSIASSSRRSSISARRWLEAKPRGRASPSVRVVTRARRTPRVRRSISTCPHARPGAPTGDFPSRVSPTAPRLM